MSSKQKHTAAPPRVQRVVRQPQHRMQPLPDGPRITLDHMRQMQLRMVKLAKIILLLGVLLGASWIAFMAVGLWVLL